MARNNFMFVARNNFTFVARNNFTFVASNNFIFAARMVNFWSFPAVLKIWKSQEKISNPKFHVQRKLKKNKSHYNHKIGQSSFIKHFFSTKLTWKKKSSHFDYYVTFWKVSYNKYSLIKCLTVLIVFYQLFENKCIKSHNILYESWKYLYFAYWIVILIIEDQIIKDEKKMCSVTKTPKTMKDNQNKCLSYFLFLAKKKKKWVFKLLF